MTVFALQCIQCGEKQAPSIRELNCRICSGLFEVSYDDVPASKETPRLPLRATGARLSLGEGGTPAIELGKTARSLGLGRLWAKLEQVAPTGSFKDRGSSVLISAAIEHGATEFVEDSSGNAGASLSAYAAAAGLKAHIFCPASASPGKLQQIEVFGATLHKVDGPRQAATDAAREFVRERGLPYLSHNHSPYFSEGMKQFSYEVARSAASGAGHIVIPVGNGSLLIGAYRGFLEIQEAGALAGLPHLHCVQSDAVRPIVAVLNGETWRFDQAGPTAASGIAVARPPRLEQTVDAVKETGGSGVSVVDAEILSWQRRLAREEGIFCEPTSAAAFAGIEALLARGAIKPGEEVLVPVTGSGLKEPLRP